MNQKIKDYLSDLIPETLPEYRKREIARELAAHILDKADYYREIGYAEEESVDLALLDMGEDNEIKKNVRSEFEELYKEKTWWAVIAGVLILVLNGFAAIAGLGMEDGLDSFITQLFLLVTTLGFGLLVPEYIKIENDIVGAAVSFGLVFILMFIVLYARSKKYRKILTAVGVVSSVIAIFGCAILLRSAYSLWTNTQYIVEAATPFVFNASAVFEDFYSYAAFAFMPLCAIYCFASARRIKNGSAVRFKSPKRLIAAFCSVYLIFAVGSVCLSSHAEKRLSETNYYRLYSSDTFDEIPETCERIYEKAIRAKDYETAADILRRNGFLPYGEYKGKLGALEKKVLTNSAERAFGSYAQDMWLPNRSDPKISDDRVNSCEPELARIIIFMCKDKYGEISFCAVGDITPFPDFDKMNEFYMGHYVVSISKNCVADFIRNFKEMKVGDGESEVLKLLEKSGTVFSKLRRRENGKVIDAVKFYSEDLRLKNSNDGSVDKEYEDVNVYAELIFNDEKLEEGRMFCRQKSGSFSEMDSKRKADTQTEIYEIK